eukprot:15443027-Alexandrium_andersonii.AAC.1
MQMSLYHATTGFDIGSGATVQPTDGSASSTCARARPRSAARRTSAAIPLYRDCDATRSQGPMT